MPLNASEHPACTLDTTCYRQVHAPRPICDELVDHRGWLHRLGIDAKAQSSPCTSAPAALTCRTLNVILGLAPAAIALFAKSPREAGRETGLKENRACFATRATPAIITCNSCRPGRSRS